MNTPVQDRQAVIAALRRNFANGALAHLPTRESDMAILVALAAARLRTGRTYREAEVNGVLRDWLAGFCTAGGPDHVTLRRCLVDAGLLTRSRDGSSYQRGPGRSVPTIAAEALAVEPAAVLEEVRREREGRKRGRPVPAA